MEQGKGNNSRITHDSEILRAELEVSSKC
jgi:hypothetical protein